MNDFISRLDEALKDLVDAAIEADMYKRDFWAQTDSKVFYNYALHKEIHRGNPGANDLGDDENDNTDYEASVFNFWPGEIDTIFDVWRNVPAPEDFEGDIDALAVLGDSNKVEAKIKPPRDLLSGEFPVFPSNDFGANLGLITSRAGDLYGTWAEAFHDEYVVPLPWVVGNQQALVVILEAAVRSEQMIWQKAQDGVLSVAKQGATWFRSITGVKSAGETVFDVASALNDGFKAVKSGISLNPFDIIDAVDDLGDAAQGLKSAIEEGSPTYGGGGSWGSVQSVYTAIAQSLEYSLNRQIVEAEELLQKVLKAGVGSIEGSPDTFVMGDNQLAKVRDGKEILDRGEVNIHKETVVRLVAALRELGSAVSADAGRIGISSLAWIRPGSIGMGVEGPVQDLLAFANAVIDTMYDTGKNLAHVAKAVELAADYAYAADESAQAELDRLNRRLDNFQDRLGNVPENLPPEVVGPYVVPPGELYIDQEDCDPNTTLPGEEPPLFPNEGRGPGPWAPVDEPKAG